MNSPPPSLSNNNNNSLTSDEGRTERKDNNNYTKRNDDDDNIDPFNTFSLKLAEAIIFSSIKRKLPSPTNSINKILKTAELRAPVLPSPN